MADLKKFSTTVLKNTSVGDPRQAPAAATTVNVHRRGATVSLGGTCSGTGATLDVTVYDIGRMVVGDALKVGTASSQSLTVDSITSATEITVKNDNLSAIVIEEGDRLVITSDPPVIYLDSTGTVVNSGTTGEFLVGAQGFVEFYLKEAVFDWIVSGGGLTTTLYVDEESGHRSPNWINVVNYPTFQDAIDAVPESGGTIFVPAGIYTRETVPQVVPMTINNKSIHFLGETAAKPYPAVTGSQIVYTGGSPDLASDLLTITGTPAEFGVKLENLHFRGAGATGAGRGLVVTGCHLLEVDNCVFQEFPSWAVATGDGATESVHMHFNKVDMLDSHSNGVCGMGVGDAGTGAAGAERVWATRFTHCNFISNYAFRLLTVRKNVLTTIRDSSFQYGAVDAADMEAIYFSDGTNSTNAIRRVVIDGCYISREAFVLAEPTSWLVKLAGPIHATVSNNLFLSQTDFGKCIEIAGATGVVNIGRICIMNNQLVKDSGDWSLSTNDIKRTGTSAEFLLINNSRQLAGTGGSDTPWRVDVPTTNMARFFDGQVMKLRGNTSAVIAADTNAAGGGLAYRVDAVNNRGGLVHYGENAQWTSVLTQTWTAATGKPSSGVWEIGDVIWNTQDKKIYIPSVRGEASAMPASSFYATVALTAVP